MTKSLQKVCMKVVYQSNKVCKKSAKRRKKSAKSAPNADFADSRRLLKKSARVCPPMYFSLGMGTGPGLVDAARGSRPEDFAPYTRTRTN